MASTSTQRALISVSDKTHVVKLAQSLAAFGIEILSTGGTANLLRKNNITVTNISAYTNFPEIMDGRVKTIHPRILGGILGRQQQDKAIMAEHGIQAIDLVIVNLYPFASTIASSEHTLTDAIENIDIGGPTMIRAAAKNYQEVAVVVDPNDYDFIIDELTTKQSITSETRFQLAKKAFAHTANYDATIANYLGTATIETDAVIYQAFPETLTLQFNKKMDLRYGENPHQTAALYIDNKPTHGVAKAKQLQGKSLSYNNIVDADTALTCVQTFSEPACVIVKHDNPCGVAQASSLIKAYEQAFRTDPTSAFGSIIAFNKEVDEELVHRIMKQQFVEVLIAPNYTEAAINAAATKPNIRLLASGRWFQADTEYDYKRVSGGLLIQNSDLKKISDLDLNIVSNRVPTNAEMSDLLFAWKVAKFVKSNAIVYAKNNMTIGIGAGQMSRVYSAKIAQIKAQDEGLDIANSVMASDAFFPFRDSIDTAAAAKVTAIIQPGGSIRDDEIIQAANEANIAMVMTGIRHFRH